MAAKPASPLHSNVERDPRLFMWFLTAIMAIMFYVALRENPALRQPLELGVFTVLFGGHVILHWQIEKVIRDARLIFGYVILQGILAFFICWMAGLEVVVFALYMALLGETVGILGLTFPSLLASLFYLPLAFVNIRRVTDPQTAGWSLLGIAPVVIFTVIYVTLYRRQTDAREQAQSLAADLEAANRQLSEYAAQVEDLTIVNERQRMARELHDTLSQGLAGIILQLEAVEAHLNHDSPEKAKAIVASAMLQARLTLADARSAIEDLRLSSMNDLESALRFEVSRFTETAGIPCTFRADPIPPLPTALREVVIRGVAEALSNIARHARAQHAGVEVSVGPAGLLVAVRDDGQGFDAQAVPSGHYGLLGLRERTRKVNGSLEIESREGSTTVKIRVPL